MLEMWFFASLRHGGVKLFDKSDEEFQTWPESYVKTLDINSFPALPENKGIWLKPRKWNQGGFDAVFITRISDEPSQHQKNPSVSVRFVQVTRGRTHSFKIGYFYAFLLDLRDHFVIDQIEIFFLVERANLSTFRIPESQISGEGLLYAFGWDKYKELEKIHIVGIDGWK